MVLPASEVSRRKTIMLRNADAFSKRVPLALQKEQRGLAREIQRRQYRDNDVKALGVLYDYVDRVMAHGKGNVACKRGCSACCKAEIALWQLEADLIAAKTGVAVRSVPLDPGRKMTPYTMTTSPCPFLVNETCSIYAYRPLACRTMVSFDADSTLCQFDHRFDTPALMMIDRATTFGGVYEAFNVILHRNGGGAGDIREFFGESPVKVGDNHQA
ncbi:YkgJ family cysteine cluster protein [Cupriavidus sp. CuC1]|uniref:YkgJ family cysteine cluster protein n=1 Tax=Cupriavidus sp. CuC1 TaxID=3373131 RepID=UPI0037D4F65E